MHLLERGKSRLQVSGWLEASMHAGQTRYVAHSLKNRLRAVRYATRAIASADHAVEIAFFRKYNHRIGEQLWIAYVNQLQRQVGFLNETSYGFHRHSRCASVDMAHDVRLNGNDFVGSGTFTALERGAAGVHQYHHSVLTSPIRQRDYFLGSLRRTEPDFSNQPNSLGSHFLKVTLGHSFLEKDRSTM
ncbi:hypothetical protein ES707_20575 [subsurface metagenome]